MIVKRFITAAVVLGLGWGLGACAGEGQFSGYVADHWPHWAGGMPNDVPPRPGAPGYDEFIAHGQSGQDAATPLTNGPGPVFEKTAAAAAKPTGKPPRAAQVTPAKNQPSQDLQRSQDLQPAQDAGPSQDTSVVKGGLY
jgi:hypothetical protein